MADDDQAREGAPPGSKWTVAQWVAALGCGGVAGYVALSPDLVYARTPRLVLFFVLGVLFLLLFAGQVQATFKLKLPGFMITATGATGVLFALLVVLAHLSESKERPLELRFIEESGRPVYIDSDGLEISPVGGTLKGKPLVCGSRVALVITDETTALNLELRRYRQLYTDQLPLTTKRVQKIVIGDESLATEGLDP